MRRLLMLVWMIFLALGNSSASAVADDKDTCRRSDDAAIMANVCGRAIASGEYRGYDLADLHQQRARGLIRQARPVDQNTTKRYDDAIVSLGEAIRIVLAEGDTDRNRLREAYYWRAYVLIEKKEFERAIADLDEAIKYKPADAFAFFRRGEAHLAKGDADRAIGDFGDAVRLDPKQVLAHSAAYENRARAYELKGEIGKALADARRADAVAKTRGHLRPTDLVKRLEQKLTAGGAKAAATVVAAPTPTAAPAPSPTPAAAPPNPASPPPAVVVAPSITTTKPTAPSAVVTGVPTITASKPAVAPLPPVALPETRVALVIGNANYRTVGKLPNPPRDAAAVAEGLRRVGFKTVQASNNLSRDGMIAALRAFEREAEKADWAVVYYAGHGIEIGGINYLIPIDASLKADRDVQDEAVPLERVLSAIENTKKLRLIILDACRDNPFVANMKRSIASRSIGRGLAQIEPEGGVLVAYAAKHGQVALDGEGANSPFVAALVKRLDTPGLDISLLFRLVRDDVLAATARRQEPFVYGSLPGEVLSFRPQ
jgi:Caspase domain/Tetratricopeptide repeat